MGLDVNRALQRGDDLRVQVHEDRSQLVQFCLRRELLADFLRDEASCAEAEATEPDMFSRRVVSYVFRTHKERCREVAHAMFTETTPSGDSCTSWMYYSHRAAAASSADRSQDE